jgi:phage repressor protein C with HTH and peptisase S24 domain
MRNKIKRLCADNDMSVSELARHIGMQPHALRRYTRVRDDGSQEAQPSVSLAQKIADVFGVSIDQVIGVDLGSSDRVRQREVKSKMPLYGAVQGGEVGFDITDVTEPIDAIDTPSWLESVPDAYAVFVTGNSMEPRYMAREVVYVHPHRPYRQGDYVVVQLHANGNTHAIVKRFVELTDTHVILSQHNPDREIRHCRENVAAIHTIVGTYQG